MGVSLSIDILQPSTLFDTLVNIISALEKFLEKTVALRSAGIGGGQKNTRHMSCHAALFDQENEVTHPVEDAVPMVDQWMERGSLLRKLREMERQDALERRLSSHPLDEEEPSEEAGDHTAASTEAGGGAILNYASYLSHQRYHDDLKHVDYRFIDFGSALSTMIIEQDKCLGKGGFCWDAAHILGDYLASEQCLRRGSTVIELGCGTGLCECA